MKTVGLICFFVEVFNPSWLADAAAPLQCWMERTLCNRSIQSITCIMLQHTFMCKFTWLLKRKKEILRNRRGHPNWYLSRESATSSEILNNLLPHLAERPILILSLLDKVRQFGDYFWILNKTVQRCPLVVLIQFLLQLAEMYLLHSLNCVNSFIKTSLTLVAAWGVIVSFTKMTTPTHKLFMNFIEVATFIHITAAINKYFLH